MSYQEVLDFLYTQLPMYQKVGKAAFNKDLGKTIRLLSALNNPQNGFKSVHVAGTNGKGSVTHMIASVLAESGYKTGIYSSPHLKSFTERIKVNGEEIKEEFVVSFVEQIKDLIYDIEPSFFEITVAMAFSYFVHEEVDVAVVEVGLGGRLDATNVITPEVSIVTSIGMDHQEFLGDTLGAIAKEKAGIVKEHIPVVVGQMEEEAYESIVEVATLKSSPVKDAYKFDDVGTYESDLLGASYERNIGTVLAAIELLQDKGYKIDQTAVAAGLKSACRNTSFKGRWQQISDQPLTFCDIGHNVQAIGAMLIQLGKYQYDQLHVVWGMSNDKPVDDVLSLLPKDAKYYFCAADIPRAMDPHSLSVQAKENGLDGEVYGNVVAAINGARSNAELSDLILIGGSVFVVAEIEEL